MTSDRLIQLSAVTIDKQTMDFQKAEKTIVLDEPDIRIKVRSPRGNELCSWFPGASCCSQTAGG